VAQATALWALWIVSKSDGLIAFLEMSNVFVVYFNKISFLIEVFREVLIFLGIFVRFKVLFMCALFLFVVSSSSHEKSLIC